MFESNNKRYNTAKMLCTVVCFIREREERYATMYSAAHSTVQVPCPIKGPHAWHMLMHVLIVVVPVLGTTVHCTTTYSTPPLLLLSLY
jgi:hypothetical protein